MYVCVGLYLIYMYVHLYMCVHVGARAQCQCLTSERKSPSKTGVHESSYTGWTENPQDPHFSSSVMGLQTMATTPGFYVGTAHLDSNHHAVQQTLHLQNHLLSLLFGNLPLPIPHGKYNNIFPAATIHA